MCHSFSNWRSSLQPETKDMKYLAKAIVYAAVTMQCAEFGAAAPASGGQLRGLSSAFFGDLFGGGLQGICDFISKSLTGFGGGDKTPPPPNPADCKSGRCKPVQPGKKPGGWRRLDN